MMLKNISSLNYKVELCRMPALAVLLSLDYAKNERQERKNMQTNTTQSGDVVPFISGLLLGSDLSIRNWFSLFIRNGQKVFFSLLLKPCSFI